MNPASKLLWWRAGGVHVPYLVILSMAVFALYGRYLRSPLVFDDIYSFLLNADGSQPISQHQFSWLQLRSLPDASLAWTLALFGRDLLYFRIGNLLLHIAVLSAVYGFVLQLRSVSVALQTAGDRRIACLAALLFAVHPVAVYAVAYLVQRTTLMATLFAVLALWAYVRGNLPGDVRYLWLSVPLYYLAVFSKEHALMLLLVFPLLTVYLHTDWRQRVRAQKWPLLTMLLVALYAVYLRRGLLADTYELGAALIVRQIGLAHPWLSSVLTQCWLFFKYIGLWLLPNTAWLSVDMREPIAPSWQSVYWLAVGLYLVWGAVGMVLVLRRGRLGLLGLVMVFPWLLFGSEMAAVRVQEPFVLYRSYLWCAGSLCFAASMPPATGMRRKGVWLVVAAVAVVFFGLSVDRLRTFSHPLLLWDDAEKLVHGRNDLPGAARIYYNRGTQNANLQRWRPAIADFQRALQLQEDFPSAYGNLGGCYLYFGDWARARDMFMAAIERSTRNHEPVEARFYLGRARAYEHLKEPALARTDYLMACQISGKGCDKLGQPVPRANTAHSV